MKLKKLKKHIPVIQTITVPGFSELGNIPVRSVSQDDIEEATKQDKDDDPGGLSRDYRLIALMLTDEDETQLTADEAAEICKIQHPTFRTSLVTELMSAAGITAARGKSH